MKNILGAYLTPHPPIIIEEIGRGEEKKSQDTIDAMKEIAKDIEKKSPSTIVLITPHGPLFRDAIAISGHGELKGSFKKFGFGNIKYSFKNNIELVNIILGKSTIEDIATVKIDRNSPRMYNVEDELDHGALVPLHFIDKEYKDFKLVHITYGLLPPKDLYKFGQLIKDALIDLDEKAVIIASGDLSHKLSNDGPYRYSPHGKVFDEKIIDLIKKGDLKDIVKFDLNLAEKAGECGLRSLMVMAGTLDGYSIDRKVLSYEGPFGVGYGTAILDVVDVKEDLTEIKDEESQYVKLARKSLEHFIKTGEYLEIEEESDIRKGVFVTLKKDGMLRGCIGTTEATKRSVEMEIIQNAVSAGTEDPRFPRVKERELEELTYSVDLLSESEPVKNIEELDVKKYGIIVSKGFRRGLLLPNLEGVDTVRHQIQIALSKAGIRQDESYDIERFKVTRYY